MGTPLPEPNWDFVWLPWFGSWVGTGAYPYITYDDDNAMRIIRRAHEFIIKKRFPCIIVPKAFRRGDDFHGAN